MATTIPSPDEIRAAVIARSNWGRWGTDDQRGTLNLITAEKKAEAAQLMKSGRTVPLARPLGPVPGALRPPVAIAWGGGDETEGGAGSWIGMFIHSQHYTVVCALSHFMGPRGAWNGKRPDELFWHGTPTQPGALWGSVEHLSAGMLTRGVLLDVPRHRGEPFVTVDEPVHGWELEAIAKAQGIEVRSGDALVINCGRDALETASIYGPVPQPGFHGTCVEYFRDVDCSAIVRDMGDYRPAGTPNRRREMILQSLAIPELGLVIVNNAILGPLARACQEEGRYEFLFVLAPLRIPDGTGSPVNPLAHF